MVHVQLPVCYYSFNISYKRVMSICSNIAISVNGLHQLHLFCMKMYNVGYLFNETVTSLDNSIFLAFSIN